MKDLVQDGRKDTQYSIERPKILGENFVGAYELRSRQFTRRGYEFVVEYSLAEQPT
jgi:hypothetical protein